MCRRKQPLPPRKRMARTKSPPFGKTGESKSPRFDSPVSFYLREIGGRSGSGICLVTCRVFASFTIQV